MQALFNLPSVAPLEYRNHQQEEPEAITASPSVDGSVASGGLRPSQQANDQQTELFLQGRFLQDAEDEEGMSAGLTVGLVFGAIFGVILLLLLIWAMFVCHYKFQRKLNQSLVEEAESKLKKALNKVEEDSSAFTKESQNVRRKLYNWEQNKKMAKEKEQRKKEAEDALTQIVTDQNENSNDII